jgi:hypothetical protein
MNKQEAKELCILKWEYIVENGGSEEGLTENYPRLRDLKAECAYCELYVKYRCDGCPIQPEMQINRLGCFNREHPYNVWYYDSTKSNAQAVLDLIKNS